jgi:CBS domain-containing protein
MDLEKLSPGRDALITEQTVIEAKRFGVFNCSQNCVLNEAARRMVEEDISALVVVDDDGFLVGILTRTDLLRAWLQVENWQSKPVKDYMNPNVITVPSQTRLSKVAELLLDKQIHRVVVTREEEDKQRPLSVVSAGDLVYHMVNAQ